VPKSPILTLAAAVTAVALGATPAHAATLSPGKRDEVKVVAFPLLAVKGQAAGDVGAHVSHSSHSSHVSGSGSHASHASHASHTSSVPAPAPTSAAVQPPPASPSPVASSDLGGQPSYAPDSGGEPSYAPATGSLPSSSIGTGSDSPTASKGSGCAFVIFAPFGAAVSWIRRLARRRNK
jgi:hypothetical protein